MSQRGDQGDSGSERRRVAASAGKELVAGSAGAAAGVSASVLLGPFAALLGPAVTTGAKRLLERFGVDEVFSDAANEMAHRSLGPQALRRVELTYTTAAEHIAKRLQKKEGLRNDGFFSGGGSETEGLPARDVLERVLHAAEEAFEERKAERLGELYAFFTVRADIAPGHAHRLVGLVRRLTYRQLLWLGLLSGSEEKRKILPDWSSSGAFTVREMAVVGELQELANLGLVLRTDRRPIGTFADINPSALQTSLEGRLLVEGMDLTRAEPEDGAEIIDAFRRLGSIDANDGSTAVDAVGLPGDPPGRRVRLAYRVVDFTPAPVHLDDDPNDIK